MADLVDAADDAAVQVAHAGDQAPPVMKAQSPVTQEPTAVPRSIDETLTEPATTPRQIDSEAREWPVEVQLPTLEYGPRPEPEVYPCRYVMNNGQRTEKEHAAHLHKAGQATNLYIWNREVQKPKGTIESLIKVWQLGELVSKVQASKHIQLCLMVHLQQVFPLRVCFQMSMKLFVNMIPPRLQLHNGYFQRKPLQQQAEVGQQGSTQKMNLQGLVLNMSSRHHLRSFQDLPQLPQHIHLVHLSQLQNPHWDRNGLTTLIWAAAFLRFSFRQVSKQNMLTLNSTISFNSPDWAQPFSTPMVFRFAPNIFILN